MNIDLLFKRKKDFINYPLHFPARNQPELFKEQVVQTSELKLKRKKNRKWKQYTT